MARVLAVACVLLELGCGGGATIVDPPPPPPAGPTVLHLIPDPADSAAARALGWSNGIPNAEVTVTPIDSSSPSRVVLGNVAGRVDLPDLTAGILYTAEVRRWLSADELNRLPASQDVLGWVTKLRVSPGGGEQSVKVPADRRHGLVISEWAFNVAAPPPVNETYALGGFLEILNNGDSTSYLDGLIIARGLPYDLDYPNWPCAVTGVFTNDPSGIWVRQVQQFPGSGREYPLQPGQTAVVATDAIDHSRIVQGGLDLSHVSFEFWGGSGDVDNPSVPNMIDTLALGGDILGHGITFHNTSAIAILGRPFSRSTLLTRVEPSGNLYGLLTADRILDVVSMWPLITLPSPRCNQLVNSAFDRSSTTARGPDENIEFLRSLSRRLLPTQSLGRPVVQWTRNSDADFVRTERTPGRVQ